MSINAIPFLTQRPGHRQAEVATVAGPAGDQSQPVSYLKPRLLGYGHGNNHLDDQLLEYYCVKKVGLREVVWVNPGTFGYDGTVR